MLEPYTSLPSSEPLPSSRRVLSQSLKHGMWLAAIRGMEFHQDRGQYLWSGDNRFYTWSTTTTTTWDGGALLRWAWVPLPAQVKRFHVDISVTYRFLSN